MYSVHVTRVTSARIRGKYRASRNRRTIRDVSKYFLPNVSWGIQIIVCGNNINSDKIVVKKGHPEHLKHNRECVVLKIS